MKNFKHFDLNWIIMAYSPWKSEIWYLVKHYKHCISHSIVQYPQPQSWWRPSNTCPDNGHQWGEWGKVIPEKLAFCKMLYQIILMESCLQGKCVEEKVAQATVMMAALRGTDLFFCFPKSSLQMTVKFQFHIEIKAVESGGIWGAWSPVWSLCSLWLFGLLYHLLLSVVLGNVCLIKSKVNAATHWEILERFMLPSADEPYGDAGFLLW